ncbi:hypothetical protein A0H81_05013 [Grifola frondosa]|uniref:Uncharacterized protein n=1 Tax=Grifola frondosa TaxID=5627 RepID=A0A1C7MGM2_GRIFR|nr:hypothetical protein A0H81_05013 [Grifola frondosa]
MSTGRGLIRYAFASSAPVDPVNCSSLRHTSDPVQVLPRWRDRIACAQCGSIVRYFDDRWIYPGFTLQGEQLERG